MKRAGRFRLSYELWRRQQYPVVLEWGSNFRRWACAEDVDCALKNCGAPFSSQSRQHHMSPLDVLSALNSARNHPWFPIQLRLPLLFRLSSKRPITKRRWPQVIL
jgi:hypothetical protein